MIKIHMGLSGSEMTPLDISGLAMPPIRAEIDDLALPFRLDIAVAVVHGKPVCTELTAERRPDGPPVTRRGLNAIPLERLVRLVAAQSTLSVTPGEGWISYEPLDLDEARSVFAELTPRRGRRSDPVAREELTQKVVAAYRDLLASGVKQPKPVIAKELSISSSYVGALLAEARRQGLLGTSIPGRAGESPMPDPAA
jgi:hypothetical protein